MEADTMIQMVRPDVAAALSELRSGSYATPPVQVVRAHAMGRPVKFCVSHPEDHIQRQHLSGRFYETEELRIIQRHFPMGGVFFDIGANVGNHGLFAALHLAARTVIVVEVNPVVYRTLIANVAVNDLVSQFDLTWLGHGVSNAEGTGGVVKYEASNLGGARIVAGDSDLSLVRADMIAGDRPIDFIKVDVEGFEMKVLAGLSGVIARCKPKLFVEVNDVHRQAFLDWTVAQGYRIADQFKRYKDNENFMIVPNTAR